MFNRYPYTNFHELNLDYFIQHFNEIFTEWEQLYNELQSWKTNTTEELDQWRADVEKDLDDREVALRAELEIWKRDTADDISEWETATLNALDAWKTAATAQFEAIRVQAAASAEAAAASQTAAASAAASALLSETAAEEAAAAIQASAAQIQQNADDIGELKESLKDLTDVNKLGKNLILGATWTGNIYQDNIKAEATIEGDTIRVTSLVNLTYCCIQTNIDVTGIDNITVSCESMTGTGQARIRLGYYENNTIIWVGSGTGTYDFTNHDIAVIALYSAYGIAQDIGAYIDYVKLQIEAGTIATPYVGTEWRLDDIDSKINTIETELNKYNLPTYYNTYMTQIEETIRNTISSMPIDSDSFIFITDVHWSYNTGYSPKMIQEIVENTPVRKIFCGGDIIDSQLNSKTLAYKALSDWRKLYAVFGLDDILYSLEGNHDYNNPGGNYPEYELTASEIVEYFKPRNIDIDFDTDTMSYCFDTNSMRYIFVPSTTNATITSNASAWAVNKITNCPTGHGIVVCVHPAVRLVDGLTSIAPTITNICNAMDNVKSEGTAVPLCIIGGHYHRDLSTYTYGGVPVIGVTCDAQREKGELTRTPGTVNEQAFDVVCISASSKTVKCVRVGGGENRTFTQS